MRDRGELRQEAETVQHADDPFCGCASCAVTWEQEWENNPVAQRLERQFKNIVGILGGVSVLAFERESEG